MCNFPKQSPLHSVLNYIYSSFSQRLEAETAKGTKPFRSLAVYWLGQTNPRIIFSILKTFAIHQ